MNTASATSQSVTALPDNQPVPIETVVLGSDETGITYVDDSGKGLFIPDSQTALPRLGSNNRSQTQGDDYISSGSLPILVLYPHFRDSDAVIGRTLNLISKAADDLLQAVEAPCNGDLETLNLLVLAEAQLFQAVNGPSFNKAFDSIVGFCAWGLRNANSLKVSPPSLQGMCSVLRELHEHPFLSMERATKLLLDLETQGWAESSYISKAFEQGLSAIDRGTGGSS